MFPCSSSHSSPARLRASSSCDGLFAASDAAKLSRLRSGPDAPGDLAGGSADFHEYVFWRRKGDRPVPFASRDCRDFARRGGGISRELDDRIRERFPFGTSEDKLIAYLASEQFVPEWRRRNDANSSSFVLDGLICKKIARVFWRADAASLLTEVGGAYESHCL